MLEIFLRTLAQLLFGILCLIIFLSLTGKSTGVREFCARLLLYIFEWASEVRATVDPSVVEDEVANVGSGGTEYEEEESEREKRRSSRKKRLLQDDRPLIDHYWSDLIDAKLHDPEYKPDINELFKPEQTDSKKPLTTTRVIVRELVEDMLTFLSAGVEAIIEDEVTERFHAAVLGNWNLLTRSRKFVQSNWKLDAVWLIGVVFRYTILLPVRFALFAIAFCMLVTISLVIGAVPNEQYRIVMNKYAMLCFFRILSRAFSSIITFHDRENRAESGIVVANHTSPIDVMILSCDNCYAMIGQKQGGFLGFIQKAVSRCAHHIWFERTEAKDRSLVRKTLQEHVNDPNRLPILIFPEGTCINNTSVMMFKKGSFEVSDVVHPIAMRYDNRLGDAFWNSSQQGYFSYLISIMTSWALRCDVYYLPAVRREKNEDPIDFARRVKRMIAQKGGLVDLEWDGNLKRTMVPEKLKVAQIDQFFAYLSRITPIRNYTPDELTEISRLSEGDDVNPAAIQELESLVRRRSINETKPEEKHLHQD